MNDDIHASRNDNLKLTHCDNPILTPPKVQLKDTCQL